MSDLPRQFLSTYEVTVLAGLVASAQQDDDRACPLDELQPVARPVVNAGLAHAIADRSDVTEVAFFHAVKAGGNRRPGAHVAKPG
jgi:hypothetical protein